jgi:hypothetical protein
MPIEKKLPPPKFMKEYDLADKSYVERYLFSNKDLINDIEEIRLQYCIRGIGYPEESDEFQEKKSEEWFTIQALCQYLSEKYSIPDNLRYGVFIMVWDEPLKEPYHYIWGPGRWWPQITKIKKRTYEYDVIAVFPENDIDDPNIRLRIKECQKRILGLIPQPTPVVGNKHGKLDWTLVWEWNLRHPGITRKYLAKLMNRHYVDVKRNLEKLDKQVEKE